MATKKTSSKTTTTKKGAPSGISYDSIVKAQGGSSVNRQTGAVTTAQGYTAPKVVKTGSGGTTSYGFEGGSSSGNASAITPESMTPVAPTPFVQPPINPVPVAPKIEDLFTSPELTKTPAETQAQSLSDRLQALNNSLVGKSADKVKADAKYGVDAAQKTITDLGVQLTGLNNEAAAIPLQLQQGAAERGVTTSTLGAQQNSRLRTNAIAALGVSSLMAAAQGQLANAQSLSDKAVEAKYAPIQEQITALTSNLQLILNSPDYTLQDKNRAQAQIDNQNRRQYQLDLAKENTSNINKIALDAAANGADAVTLQKIQGAKTAVEAMQYSNIVTEAKNAVAFAQKNNVSTPFFTQGGLVRRTADGKAYETPEEFYADGGAPDFSNAPQVADANGKLLSVAEAKSLGVPYGTTVGQAIQLGITPTTPKRSSGGGSRSSGGSSSGGSYGPANPGSKSSGGFTAFPKTASANNLRNWLASNWHAKASRAAYYDVWGQAAEIMRENGVDPSTPANDKLLWDVFRPGEYANYKKENKDEDVDKV